MDNPVNNSGNETDICFHGINLTGALVALAALQSGCKVSIELNQKPDLQFLPELIALYPISAFELPNSVSRFKLLQKIAGFYPTLVYPQRLLTLVEDTRLKAKKLSFFDLLLGREREEASMPVRFSKYDQYKSIEQFFENGAMISEFRFDRNMLLIGLLGECSKAGARIFINSSSIKSKATVFCTQQPALRQIYFSESEFLFKNNLRIVMPQCEILLQKTENGFISEFQTKQKNITADFCQKAAKYLQMAGAKQPEDQIIDAMLKLFSDKEESLNHDSKQIIIRDTNLYALKKECNAAASSISRKIRKRIKFRTWFNKRETANIDTTAFKQIMADCDEKFDLAKQTGIDYHRFCYYYYRFSKDIDILTEQAYEEMNSTRNDPEKIWEKVEKQYLDNLLLFN